jgi:hypothetical protein
MAANRSGKKKATRRGYDKISFLSRDNMKTWVLFALSMLSCTYPVDEIDMDRIRINNLPLAFSLKDMPSIFTLPDSAYRDQANACLYLNCDTCDYIKIQNTWYIRDNDSVFFQRMRFNDTSRVSIDDIVIDHSASPAFLKSSLSKEQYMIIEQPKRNETVFSISLSNKCNLYIRFNGNKVQEILYGIYGFIPE